MERRVDLVTPWPYRLRPPSMDGLLRRRGPGLQRLLRHAGRPVLAGAVQVGESTIRLGARGPDDAAVDWALARMRFALGLDDDLREFHHRFAGDPVVGRAVRELPWLRVWRTPLPWPALFAAVTEQLIELERAKAIQRRIIARFGYRCPQTGLRDTPAPETIAALAPAQLAAFDLAPKRALALTRVAQEVASGRVDLDHPDHEAGWRRLRAIREIGPWTVECLALFGQGRQDQVPAGDLAYLKLIGRLSTGRPHARADIDEVRGFFAPYGDWKGLAGTYLLMSAKRGWI